MHSVVLSDRCLVYRIVSPLSCLYHVLLSYRCLVYRIVLPLSCGLSCTHCLMVLPLSCRYHANDKTAVRQYDIIMHTLSYCLTAILSLSRTQCLSVFVSRTHCLLPTHSLVLSHRCLVVITHTVSYCLCITHTLSSFRTHSACLLTHQPHSDEDDCLYNLKPYFSTLDWGSMYLKSIQIGVLGLLKSYVVASIGRLLTMIGLFCKRALWKRRYSAKETCIFKEPTNRSHPMLSSLYHAHSVFFSRAQWLVRGGYDK